ncbi:sialate O-acetylesterase [Niabella ginsengisoli]|uniref:sialate O-acetylesterase n=1 Tax=Niabella ginsengisoli TaxID=522298 RepID=UPI00374D04AF
MWYQGEYDRFEPQLYRQQLEALVAAWRKLWKDDFPFYFVQIAPYNYPDVDSVASARVREAQLQAPAVFQIVL